MSNLHKTSSIYIRNLAPYISYQELKNIFSTYKGYKRIALADPDPRCGLFRSGWVTFDSSVDVKEICLSAYQVSMNATAYQLTNRIRAIPNILSSNKNVIKNDLKCALKIVEIMDKRWNLWQEQDSYVDDSFQLLEPEGKRNLEKIALSELNSNNLKYLAHNFQGSNPLLKKIINYLNYDINQTESFDLEIDCNCKKFLDELILYLRVVHSIDFYGLIEYKQEDCMPFRLGIMHVRPLCSVSIEKNIPKTTQNEIDEYNEKFERNIELLANYNKKSDVSITKNIEDEVEDFIKKSSKELLDKWICDICNQKYKSKFYIRKHLFKYHMDLINEIKDDVEYFNNYANDPFQQTTVAHKSDEYLASNISDETLKLNLARSSRTLSLSNGNY